MYVSVASFYSSLRRVSPVIVGKFNKCLALYFQSCLITELQKPIFIRIETQDRFLWLFSLLFPAETNNFVLSHILLSCLVSRVHKPFSHEHESSWVFLWLWPLFKWYPNKNKYFSSWCCSGRLLLRLWNKTCIGNIIYRSCQFIIQRSHAIYAVCWHARYVQKLSYYTLFQWWYFILFMRRSYSFSLVCVKHNLKDCHHALQFVT